MKILATALSLTIIVKVVQVIIAFRGVTGSFATPYQGVYPNWPSLPFRPARSFRRNGNKRYGQNYYRTLIGRRMCSVHWRHPRRSWSTFQGQTQETMFPPREKLVRFWPWSRFALSWCSLVYAMFRMFLKRMYRVSNANTSTAVNNEQNTLSTLSFCQLFS